MAFIQMFSDDSASEIGDRRLFLAGYLNSAANWALFADAWDRVLHATPAIDYFKMSEAYSLLGQFDGWHESARDKKLDELAKVIKYFTPHSFQCSINRKRYYEVITPVSPRGLGRPHFECCFGIISIVSRYAAEQRLDLPIDFIFDKQDGVSDDFRALFVHMKKALPLEARKLINDIPIFRDDKQFVQLQAADMLVWHLRGRFERG